MAIPATKPTNVPAQSARVYDKWWMTQMMVQAGDPNKKVRATVMLKKYATLPDGSFELEDGQATTVVIDDLFHVAQSNTDVATAISALMTAVASYGASKGVL